MHLDATTAPDLRTWALSLLKPLPGLPRPAGAQPGAPYRLHRLCHGLARALCLQGVSIELRSRQGGEAVAAASDERARAHAKVGLDTGEGPAYDAFALGRPVLVADLGGSLAGRWWAYSPAARAAGVNGVFVFPLQVGVARFGVLSVYEGAPRRLDTDELARILAVAEVATEVLLDSVGSGPDGAMDQHLESALAFRSEVYQAQGMVMALLGISLPAALARLRAHAFAANRDLTDVAIDIVEGRLRLAHDQLDQDKRDQQDQRDPP